MGLLEQGAKWLENQRMSGLTVPATYVRRGGLRIDVDATVGRTLFRAEDQYGIAVPNFLYSTESSSRIQHSLMESHSQSPLR